ncbi:MAG: hypothetical protein KJ804_04065 [Proteobacteria bacterium]|nr:hypothetical protein [Pseudomonadota bacterium]MBU1057479.1 hypothetical protein [Pseudomonadota bacterium]
MIRTRLFLSCIAFLLVVLAILALHSQQGKQVWITQELAANQDLVARLALTDLALWTEARYTRHPALADFFSPFQDAPASFEHFPAGSIIAPRLPAVSTTLRVRKRPLGGSR